MKQPESYEKRAVVFPQNERGMLLGIKRHRWGEGRWSGFEGRLQEGESYEELVRREAFEQAGIQLNELSHIANIHYFFENTLKAVAKAYVTDDYIGKPVETEDLRLGHFSTDHLPWANMHPVDKRFLSIALGSRALPIGFIVKTDGRDSWMKLQRASRLERKFK